MENLIQRATKACSVLKIDPDDLISIRSMYETFRGSMSITGTILEYYNWEGHHTYALYTIDGRAKEWVTPKSNNLSAIESMVNMGLKQSHIAQILGISQSTVSLRMREIRGLRNLRRNTHEL